MIAATIRESARLHAQLVERARQAALAAGEDRLRAHRLDPQRWRKARLLWPLFGRER